MFAPIISIELEETFKACKAHVEDMLLGSTLKVLWELVWDDMTVPVLNNVTKSTSY